jgi:hypothetical protein
MVLVAARTRGLARGLALLGFSGLSVQGQEVFGGAFAARATSSGAPVVATQQLPAPQSELVYSLRFKILSQGANNVSLGKLRTATGGAVLAFYRGASGKLGVVNETIAASRTSSGVVSAGAWHLVSVHVLLSGGSGLSEVFLDGAKVGELGRTESLGTTPVGRVQLDDNQTGRSYDVACDDLSVSAAGGGGGTTSFGASGDARVQEWAPGTNFGTSFLKAEGGVDPDVESYLRFDVTGLTGTVQGATLRLFATSDTMNGPSVSSTSTGWRRTASRGTTGRRRARRGTRRRASPPTAGSSSTSPRSSGGTGPCPSSSPAARTTASTSIRGRRARTRPSWSSPRAELPLPPPAAGRAR